jgi:hypothetical protein
MPSVNVLRFTNLSTAVDSNGFTKNLVFWGDEATINSGSSTWDNKLPYGLPDASLIGSGYARSGSAGFAFDGSTNYVQWNTGSFSSLNSNSGLVGDGYTISVTLTPDNSTISYTGFGGGAINIYRPYALWQPTLTQNPSNVGYLPGIQMNDACPSGGQKSYWMLYNSGDAYLRNSSYYDWNGAPDLNLNLVFVFSKQQQAYGPVVNSYINGVFNPQQADKRLDKPLPPNFYMQQFGKALSASTGDSSIADDYNTNCGGVSSNMPFYNFKGYVRDFAIWNRALAPGEVKNAYTLLNAYSRKNNL